jgi:hypothetical protein
MQTSGTSCLEKEDAIFDAGRPQSVDLNSHNCNRSEYAGRTVGHFAHTTLTERVVEFLERYN